MAKKKTTKKQIEVGSSIRSRSVHGKTMTPAWQFGDHLIPPLTASTTFRLHSLERGAQGFIDFGDPSISLKDLPHPILIYDRLEEPTTLMLEEQLAMVEGADCAITFGSGMGAISGVLLGLVGQNKKILAHKTLYGCTFSLLTNWLPRFGIKTDFIDLNSSEFALSIKDKDLKVIYFESVCNPSLTLIDISKISKAVALENKKRKKEDQIKIVVDNTFATPWGIRPLDLGADFVVHSLTKNISGFGTEMGGAILTSKKYERYIKMIRKDFGAVINPYSAWHILVYGLPTLALRFERQQETALKIAQFLEKHPKVESVTYPGLKSFPQHNLAKKMLRSPEGKFSPGFMISFRLKGNMNVCKNFVDDIAKNSYSITLAVSLGLTKTLIEVPGFMTHSAIPSDKQQDAGFDPRDIRLSVGIEGSEDLIHDLERSLKKI